MSTMRAAGCEERAPLHSPLELKKKYLKYGTVIHNSKLIDQLVGVGDKLRCVLFACLVDSVAFIHRGAA